MNTTSSRIASIENAVLSCERSRIAWDQRARTMLPVCGVASPATTTNTYAHGVAQSCSTARRKPAIPTAYPAPTPHSTEAWPMRSASRPCSGPNAAAARTYAAAVIPASP
jgi:hypothetical protein